MIVTGAAVPSRRPEPQAPPLAGGARVEICIAGAGVAGMIAAYLLAREGRKVMLVDEGVAAGAHAASGAIQLAAMIEPPYLPLEREHGAAAARLAAQGFRGAVDAIEAIVRRERIACDFERLDGYCLGAGRLERAQLEHEAEAARQAGLPGVEVLDVPPVAGALEAPCVRYPGQAQFHPQKFVAGLARAVARVGGRLHLGVGMKSLDPGRPAAVVTSGGHRIEAGAIVTAGRRRRDAARPTRALALRVPRGALTRALYWDASSPQCCARLRTTGAGAGEHLLVMGDSPDAELEAWARARFPSCGEVLQRLDGDSPASLDLFACVGQGDAGADGVYVSTAGWGSAMTRAAIAAITVRDFVQASYFERDFAYIRM